MNNEQETVLDELELEIYGRERTDLRRQVSAIHTRGMAMVTRMVETLKKGIKPPARDVLIGNLQAYATSHPSKFWEAVTEQINKFGAVGIQDLYTLSPVNNDLMKMEREERMKLQKTAMKLSHPLSKIATACLFWIDENQLEPDVLGELMSDLEEWKPEGYDEMFPQEETTNAITAGTDADL